MGDISASPTVLSLISPCDPSGFWIGRFQILSQHIIHIWHYQNRSACSNLFGNVWNRFFWYRIVQNIMLISTICTKSVTCRRKHKLSFSYVQKEEKMGFNLVQKNIYLWQLVKKLCSFECTQCRKCKCQKSRFKVFIYYYWNNYLLPNTAFLEYLNTYFMCDTWPYDS